jgi:hypothetical protein
MMTVKWLIVDHIIQARRGLRGRQFQNVDLGPFDLGRCQCDDSHLDQFSDAGWAVNDSRLSELLSTTTKSYERTTTTTAATTAVPYLGNLKAGICSYNTLENIASAVILGPRASHAYMSVTPSHKTNLTCIFQPLQSTICAHQAYCPADQVDRLAPLLGFEGSCLEAFGCLGQQAVSAAVPSPCS